MPSLQWNITKNIVQIQLRRQFTMLLYTWKPSKDPKVMGGGHHSNSRGKSVQFDDDDDDDDDEGDYKSHDENYDTAVRSRSVFPSPSRNRQTLRKVNKNTLNTLSNQSREQSPAITEEKDILQKFLSFMEKSDNNALQNNLPQTQDKRGQGNNSNAQGHMYNQNNGGQGHVASQGQNQGQGRYANLQCFHCSERGHLKVNCPVLKAEREQGFQPQRNRGQMPFPQPYIAQNIDLN